MSDAVAPRPAAVAATPTKEQIAEFVENPLKQLPIDWRPAVWDFWSFYSHLLPTQLALCTRIRYWMQADGLDFETLTRAFDRMRQPGRCREHQFASQVLASLADDIETVREERRQAERKARDWDGKLPASAPIVTNLAEHFRTGGRA